jgi:hypothetical protein
MKWLRNPPGDYFGKVENRSVGNMGLRSLASQFLRREPGNLKTRDRHYSTSSSSEDDDDPKRSKSKTSKDSEMASATKSLSCETKQSASSAPSSSSALLKLARSVLARKNSSAGGLASSVAFPLASGSTARGGATGGGGGRSVSSNSQSTGGRTGPFQKGEPLKRQITGPFQLDEDAECCSYFLDDEDDEGDNGGDGRPRDKGDVLRLDGRKFEITDESKKIILRCLAKTDDRQNSTPDLASTASPQYQVEICAKGFGDDDTLDGIMTEKLSQERAWESQTQRGGLLLFRARSGGSSSGGILSSLRGRSSTNGGGGGSAASLSKPNIPTTIIQGRTARAGGAAGADGADDDTLDEFMSREFKEVRRPRERDSNLSRSSGGSSKLLRVGSGILERLDRLRRSNSKLLDRNELWLKRSLEAIEEAKFSYHTSQYASRKRFRPTSHVIVERSVSPLEVRSANADERAAGSASSVAGLAPSGFDDKERQTQVPTLLAKFRDKVEAMLPRFGTDPHHNMDSPISDAEEEPTAPSVPHPAEDDASVTLAEVIVHYLTCGHVLRENELQRSPRVTFSTPEAAATTFCAPPIPLVKISPPIGGQAHRLRRSRPLLHPRGLCTPADWVSAVEDDEDDDNMDDDEERTYHTDDDTQELSLRRHTSNNSVFALSTAESTYGEKKGEDQ